MPSSYDSTDEAVVRGLARTGRLVTGAALIVFFAFASMATAAPVEVKVLATGLAARILFDGTAVRTLLVPAVVSIFGRWNWSMPEPALLLNGPSARASCARGGSVWPSRRPGRLGAVAQPPIRTVPRLEIAPDRREHPA
ncbi:MAG: MMPL family transporter [Actinomycetota bacterium]|nr:MMPL family transporter [Actinomycetota bacterium]